MDEQKQKTKKKIYKHWWFWVAIVIIIIIIAAASGGTKEENPEGQISTNTIDYTVLREWSPDGDTDSIGMEILIKPEDATEQNIIDLAESISAKTGKAIVKIYQNQEAWEQEQNEEYGEEYDSGYLAFYVKNLTDAGAYKGNNEIRWFQESGQLQNLMGTKTEIK